MITVGALVAAGLHPTQARQFVQPLATACQRFDISTPARIGGFIAQCRVESDDLRKLEESLAYRTPERVRAVFPTRVLNMNDAARLVAAGPRAIANRVYADKGGNGNEASGDGWRYRGRGILQLTLRNNYADAATALGRPYLDDPDLVAMPDDACLVAAWYWHTVKGNALADSAQWDAITRAINGPAMLHADLRRQYSVDAAAALRGHAP